MNDSDVANLVTRLLTTVENMIDEKMNRLPISLPAKVEERKKSTVSVLPLITFGSVDAARIDDVPIAKSPYFNDPIQKGDFGLLVPCSYFYQSIVTDNLNKIDSVIPTLTTGNYVFFPLCRYGDNPSDGTESEIWSKGKSRKLKVKNDRIELNGTSGYATEYTALNTALQGFITAFGTHTHTCAAPGSPTTPPLVTVTLDISGAKKETVTL